jgi:pimeloyl-ACP methyl ester carboxylesterase
VQAACVGAPLVVGWSHGTWVAIDYLSVQRRPRIAGLVLVGGLGGLVPPTPRSSPRLAELLTRTATLAGSGYLEDSLLRGQLVMHALAVRPIDTAWNDEMAAANALLPPFARTYIQQRSLDHSAMLKRLSMRTLVVMGSEDPTQGTDAAFELQRRAPNVEVRLYPGTGHLPFAEQPEEFNVDLARFASEIFSATPR